MKAEDVFFRTALDTPGRALCHAAALWFCARRRTGVLKNSSTCLRTREGHERRSFSLELAARGARAPLQGRRLRRAGRLDKISGPVLVYIEPRGYKHFAVLRGVKGGRVYLADPARGNIRMPLYAFVETWRLADGRGIIFVVEPNGGPPVAASPLALTATRPSQPEIMSVREKVAVDGPVSLFHDFARQIP